MNLQTLRLIDLPAETLVNVYTNLNDQGMGRFTQTCRFLYDEVHLYHKEWIHKASIFHNTHAGFWTERKVHLFPSAPTLNSLQRLYLCLKKQQFLILRHEIINNNLNPRIIYSRYEIKSSTLVEVSPPSFDLGFGSKITVALNEETVDEFKTQVDYDRAEGGLRHRGIRGKEYVICQNTLLVLSIEPRSYPPNPLYYRLRIGSIAVLGDTLFVIADGRALMFKTKNEKFLGYFEEDVKDFNALNVDEEKGILYALTSTAITTYDFSGSQKKENMILRALKKAVVFAYYFFKITIDRIMLDTPLKYAPPHSYKILVGASLLMIGIGGGLQAVVIAVTLVAILILFTGILLALEDNAKSIKTLTRATFTRP